MKDAPGAPRSLYVHIPFCERKCQYCDFVSVAGTRGEDAYVAALLGEIEHIGTALPGTRLATIFFGGGTPGLIEPANLGRLLETIGRRFTIEARAEITLEANPSSTSAARASAWRAAGFNRVSLGVQSFEPAILQFLGRVHDAERAASAVADVREGGFDNVNCDLIYAVPGLDDERWQATLARLIGLAPDHISCYELTVEEGTPLHRLVAQGRVRPVDAVPALRQHWIAVDTLEGAGYRQYEVSNFATPGRECRHNLVYWRNETYLAAGVGAHGHLDVATARALALDVDDPAVAMRYWHDRSVARYLDGSASRGVPVAGIESVGIQERSEETAMLGLRLAEGVDAGAFAHAEISELVESGLLEYRADRVAATRRGQEVLNALVARLVTGGVRPVRSAG